MADEGFENYHIPQQSRREKLRYLSQNQTSFIESSPTLNPSYSPLPSLYDPSLISAIDVINSNPFLYQNLREMNHVYNDGGGSSSSNNNEVMLLKSEPLSLSLSSNKNNQNQMSANLQCYGSVVDVSSNTVPLGPFTGYASVLKGSRFLKPAQQLLDEICDVGVRAEKIIAAADVSLMETNHVNGGMINGVDDDTLGDDGRKNNSRLLTVLDEVHSFFLLLSLLLFIFFFTFASVSGQPTVDD